MYYKNTFSIGDLITINNGPMGIIIGRKKIELMKDFMYRIHFCGENEADQRWIFSDGFKGIL